MSVQRYSIVPDDLDVFAFVAHFFNCATLTRKNVAIPWCKSDAGGLANERGAKSCRGLIDGVSLWHPSNRMPR